MATESMETFYSPTNVVTGIVREKRNDHDFSGHEILFEPFK